MYATTESYEITIGSGTVAGEITTAANEKFIGAEAYTTADKLDYVTYWAAIVGEIPVLQSFKGDKVVAEKPSAPQPPAGPIEITAYEENKTATEFVVKNVEQLYKFAELSSTYTFEGQKINLDKNLTVNQKITNNARVWTPIGTSEKPFKGTFDGQGHTISGLYYNSENGTSIGLFGCTAACCTIKDFEMRNCYFKGKSHIGSVVGQGGGTITDIYSNATITCSVEFAGGMIGYVDAAISNSQTEKNLISNCQFDGAIHNTRQAVADSKGAETGGMVGRVYGTDLTIQHCLNSGNIDSQISSSYARIGGMCGTVAGSNMTVRIIDSLNVGTIAAKGNATQQRAIVGFKGSTATCGLILNDVYAIKGSAVDFVQALSGASSSTNSKFVSADKLNGEAFKTNTTLSEEYWMAQISGAPVLKSFYLYPSGKTEFYIDNVADLYEFAVIASQYDLTGKTFYLGANITINKGTANELLTKATDTDQSNDPREWIPIGTSEKPFKGTFDGQGHTISGLYYNSENGTSIGLFGCTAACCTIKDFEMRNCYFKGKSHIGSVVGQGGGTITDIYSNATITCSVEFAGGMIGYVDAAISNSQTEKNLISNCQFDGAIHNTRQAVADSKGAETGGMVGRVYGTDLTIQHCLNSGNIDSQISSSYARIGGMCGTVAGSNMTVRIIDSLNVGTIAAKGNATQQRAIVGFKGSTATCGLILNDVYAIEESAVDFVQALSGASSSTNSKFVTADKLNGEAFKTNTTLSESYWIAGTSYPMLKGFSSDTQTQEMALVSFFNRAVAVVTNLFE